MLNKAFIELFGDVNSFSPGTGMIMADRQIKRALERDEISIDEIGNAKAVARLRNGKWFMLFGGWDYEIIPQCSVRLWGMLPDLYTNGTISNVKSGKTN